MHERYEYGTCSRPHRLVAKRCMDRARYRPCQFDPVLRQAMAVLRQRRLSLALNRWAGDRTVRAENATIAAPGLQHRVARQAREEELAGILRHRFKRDSSTMWAGEPGLNGDWRALCIHGECSLLITFNCSARAVARGNRISANRTAFLTWRRLLENTADVSSMSRSAMIRGIETDLPAADRQVLAQPPGSVIHD